MAPPKKNKGAQGDKPTNPGKTSEGCSWISRGAPEGMEVDDDGTSAPPEEEKKDAAPNEAPKERGFGQPDEASENPGSNANAAEPQFKAEEDDGLFLTEHTGKKAHTGDNSSDELEELGDIGRITSVISLVDSKLDISIKGPFGKWYAIYRDGPRYALYYHMGRMADD
ncbi:uncharacterized protein F5Z01DRAFT_640018 [Emericellopsis atlantica]|uniref:Uncharacterized protein n=1 Tax=Emericellopsis atlantica TaxID=2614577 RepID=A0A9P7ZF40_9HYPO|nr:uncharacterized protein F5Z01DRAFT_640018 [Emericellopsis atlantica]KAG9250781.1 hypothetical protein F5Z01DRAFT_640018 [Emericellopsis atlantica]